MKQPKKKFTGISARCSNGRWTWRALIKVAGKQRVGQYRETQEEAYEDRKRLLAESSVVLATEAPTLGSSVRATRDAWLRRQPVDQMRSAEDYWEANEEAHARFLYRYWKPDMRMAGFTKTEIETFIAWCLSDRDTDGQPKRVRVASTLVGKDLRLLKLCFKQCGMPWPDVENVPARNRPVTHFFTIPEAREVVRRMRTEVFLDKRGNLISIPQREHHADLVELILHSGIRVGELTRVRLDDIDLAGGRIFIRHPKVDGQVRWAMIQESLAPVVVRLVAWSKERRHERLVNGGEVYICTDVLGTWRTRLNEPRLNGRCLRHTAITAMLQSGATLPETMNFAGHSRATTTDKYVHALTQRQGVVAARLSGVFSDAPQPTPASQVG